MKRLIAIVFIMFVGLCGGTQQANGQNYQESEDDHSGHHALDAGHLAITLYETFSGFFIGAVFGIGLGFALGRREVLAQILDPYVVNAIDEGKLY